MNYISQFKVIREISLFNSVIYYNCYLFFIDANTFLRILTGISPFVFAFFAFLIFLFLTSLPVTFERVGVGEGWGESGSLSKMQAKLVSWLRRSFNWNRLQCREILNMTVLVNASFQLIQLMVGLELSLEFCCFIISWSLTSNFYLRKNCFIYFNERLLKIMKNAFVFHLKSSFRSQDF